jgi:hypothetical protein
MQVGPAPCAEGATACIYFIVFGLSGAIEKVELPPVFRKIELLLREL